MSLATIAPTDALVPAAPVGPVTLRDELELWQDAFEFAKAIAPTAFVPKDLRNNPPAVMACIIKGHELGVSALHALSQIHIIEGRPCVAAELQRALILAQGHELWTEDYTTTRVTLCGRRRNGDHVQKVTWTMDNAKQARLDGKPNWRAYPRPMLLARCSGELGRLMFADVLAGLGVNLEELTDGGVIDVTALADDPAAPAAPTTRRTTRRKSAAATPPSTPGKAAQGPPAQPQEPGGPPPPLPGDEGYEEAVPTETPVSSDPDTPGSAGERHSGPDPVESDEPAEVVTKRAQSIAMRAQKAHVDHHHVIAAVTHGNKSSAKAVTAAEADAVLHALVDIEAGRLELLGSDDDGWHLVEPELEPAEAAAPDETKVAEYQRRIRDLKEQKAELDRGGQQALPDPDERTES